MAGSARKKKGVDLKYKSSLVNSVPLVHCIWPADRGGEKIINFILFPFEE